ncbi:helix-turn-helix transcriptional regulator [Nocardia sp. NPDC051911]|uniref:helix-turn-helix transcriptional regulator n=2 Tax=unclassified Nocardia TaxID=2637762 RepID=UPI0034288D0D
MTHRVSGRIDSGRPEPPSFGSMLRRLRDERRVSREKLAFAAGVSASYVAHLESGERARPTMVVVEALVGYLKRVKALTDAERRHLYELAGLSISRSPSIAELCAEITEDMRQALVAQEPGLAGFVDTRWNVLACNRPFARAFPGLVDDMNILRWFFGNPLSRRVIVEWEREAGLMVRWLRGLIGPAAESEWPADLLAELAEYADFRRMWAEGIAVYGRERSAMHFRDNETGTQHAVHVQVFRLDSGNYPGWIQYYLGTSVPQRAPSALLELPICGAANP